LYCTFVTVLLLHRDRGRYLKVGSKPWRARFWAERHISRANCAKINNWDRQAA